MSSAFRVTESTISGLTLANLQTNLAHMQRIQEELSSGRRVNRASDSPTDAVLAALPKSPDEARCVLAR